MSADNGIYILKTKDSYRVIHQQAIENLFYSYINSRFNNGKIVPTRAVEMFGNARYTRDLEKALFIANKLDREYQTEYGVKIFDAEVSWRKLLISSKKLAKEELEYLKLNPNFSYSFSVNKLENLLKL